MLTISIANTSPRMALFLMPGALNMAEPGTTKEYPRSEAPSLDDYHEAEKRVCPGVCHRPYTDIERADIVGTAWQIFRARQSKH